MSIPIPDAIRAINSRIYKGIHTRLAGAVCGVNTTQQVAALTFDDGPDPVHTPRLLELLAQYQAKATFFMLGKLADRYPDLVRQVADAGHVIGNHTWDHAPLGLMSTSDAFTQLSRCQRAISPYGSRLFRPPFGNHTCRTHLNLIRWNYQVIGWNITVADWLDHDVQTLYSRLVCHLAPGAIILLHDNLYQAADPRYASRQSMHSALRLFLQNISPSYRFVTIPELLHCGPKRYRILQRNMDPAWLASLCRCQ